MTVLEYILLGLGIVLLILMGSIYALLRAFVDAITSPEFVKAMAEVGKTQPTDTKSGGPYVTRH